MLNDGLRALEAERAVLNAGDQHEHGLCALRGLHDVRVPTVITFIAYWVISLPLGYWLAFHTSLGAVGLWTGLAAGLGCAAMLLGWRFHRLTKT